jgi:hypothetical protein
VVEPSTDADPSTRVNDRPPDLSDELEDMAISEISVLGGEDPLLDVTDLERQRCDDATALSSDREPVPPALNDDELRTWIDQHDPPIPEQPTTELEAQRTRHTAERAGATERPDDAMASLINNTGDDGGAATG